MKPKPTVYGIEDPRTNQIVYVGSTFQPKAREANHHSLRELRKQGLLPKFIILEQVSEIINKKQLEELEGKWMKQLRLEGNELVNVRFPGETREERKQRRQKFRQECKQRRQQESLRRKQERRYKHLVLSDGPNSHVQLWLHQKYLQKARRRSEGG